MTTQQRLTKAQHHSIEVLCWAIRLIEELVPQEQQRFSQARKRKLESAYETLQYHARKLEISLPTLSLLYNSARYLEHASVVADALANRFAPDWQRCEKLTPTRARVLTLADYETRCGIIETREGPTPFAVGDYLAEDDLGEYPIGCPTIAQGYVLVEPPDSQGWAVYRSTECREARQQFRAFTTDRGVTGQAGDYLMRGSDGHTWPCAKTKFEQEYHWLGREQSDGQ